MKNKHKIQPTEPTINPRDAAFPVGMVPDKPIEPVRVDGITISAAAAMFSMAPQVGKMIPAPAIKCRWCEKEIGLGAVRYGDGYCSEACGHADAIYIPAKQPPSQRNRDDEAINSAITLLCALRRNRDEKRWAEEGAHTFREWCVKQFGERLGCFIDDVL